MFVDKIREIAKQGGEHFVIILGIKGIAIRIIGYPDKTTYIYDYNGQLLSIAPLILGHGYIIYNIHTIEIIPDNRHINYEYDMWIFPAKIAKIHPRYLCWYDDDKFDHENAQKIEKLVHQFRYSGPFQGFWITDIGFNYLPPNIL